MTYMHERSDPDNCREYWRCETDLLYCQCTMSRTWYQCTRQGEPMWETKAPGPGATLIWPAA
jgi:hypothetical protein